MALEGSPAGISYLNHIECFACPWTAFICCCSLIAFMRATALPLVTGEPPPLNECTQPSMNTSNESRGDLMSRPTGPLLAQRAPQWRAAGILCVRQ